MPLPLTRLHKHWKLLLLASLFFLAALLPAGFLSALAEAPDYSVRQLDVVESSTQSFEIEYDVFAYAFRWTGGTFKFGVDSDTLNSVTVSHDLTEGEAYFSEMYFGLDAGDKIAVSNINATDIELILIDPKGFGIGANGDTFTAAGLGERSLVNRNSGADYSDLGIISRAEWGADESVMGWDPKYKKKQGVIVHHTAWPNDPDDYARTVRAIYLFHAVGRGWGDIGYNYLIDPNGRIYEGRVGGASAIGAHAGGYNGNYIGISMMGDFTSEGPTANAIDSLQKLLAERSLLHNFDLNWGSTVIGHRDVNSTSCPGTNLYGQLPAIVVNARSFADSWSGDAVAQARATAEAALVGYTDTRLRVEFTDEALATYTPAQLRPAHSGIIYRKYGSDYAIWGMESIPGYSNDWSDDTFNRLEDLYTIFLLDRYVESVSIVEDTIVPVKYLPAGNSIVELEHLDNPILKYSGVVKLGTGDFTLVDDETDEVLETISTTETDKVQIHYNGPPEGRHLNIYFDYNYAEGKTYRVEICDTCILDAEDDSAIPGESWKFEINITQFTPVYRFFSNFGGVHFFTASTSERDKLRNDEQLEKAWAYENRAFGVLSKNQCSKGSPVYRLWSRDHGRHFYTVRYSEYQKLTTDTDLRRYWADEGIAFCAYTYEREGTVPVYRFNNLTNGAHLYTTSASERGKITTDSILKEVWADEGVAFYAAP